MLHLLTNTKTNKQILVTNAINYVTLVMASPLKIAHHAKFLIINNFTCIKINVFLNALNQPFYLETFACLAMYLCVKNAPTSQIIALLAIIKNFF